MNRSRKLFRYGLAVLAALCVIVIIGLSNKSKADDVDISQDGVNQTDYISGHYEGVVNKDGSRVRKTPGSKDASGNTKNDGLKTSKGKDVILDKGAKVTIYGERYDTDLDIWYHVTFKFQGEDFEGYIYKGRVTRNEALIKNTPTPAPTDEPTPSEPTPTVAEQDDPLDQQLKNPTPTQRAETKEDLEKDAKDPSNKYIPLLVIAGVLLLAAIVYTVVTYISDRRIDAEMHKNSRKKIQVDRLEEESEESFHQAKKDALKPIISDKRDRDIADEIGVEDFQLDLDGVFDDDVDAQGVVSEAIAEAVSEEVADHEAVATAKADADEAKWNKDNADIIKHLSNEADDQEKELIRQIVPNYEREKPAEPARDKLFTDAPAPKAAPSAADIAKIEELRRKLDQLKEQDTIVHKEYGVGEVIDNSDAQIIQVRFGRDLRFLKKDRLARRMLVEL